MIFIRDFVFLFLLHIVINKCYGKQGKESVKPGQGCKLEGLHPLLIVTYKNITISVDKITVPHNEKLQIRCRELGRYKLIGDHLLHCRNGIFNGIIPTCIPTTAISNYTGNYTQGKFIFIIIEIIISFNNNIFIYIFEFVIDDVPPTIIFGLPAGSAAIEPSGALAVFPESILHLECLFSRKLGNPEWTWTSAFRQHLTGWAIATTERDIKYRLSIYYAKTQDSGLYICTTPKGLTNSIQVRVINVHCPSIATLKAPLIGKIEGAKMGQTVKYECPLGYRLEGMPSMTCQYNGKWSAEVPHCEAIVCPPIVTSNPKLQLLEHNNSFGGKVVFSCMWGSEISGSQSIKCEGDGVWSDSIPTCIEITCPAPIIPRSGRIIEHASILDKEKVHKVGALVRFACLPGHQLLGEASIICLENGKWSHQSPVCDTRCPYPGDPLYGQIAPLKFWYKPGDNIQVTCSPGYVTPLEPVKKPTCRENGMWSSPPPPCRSYKDV
ncbi:locomotion-related protein Hikaru genki-like isoform X2 [Leptopilina boulardi]|uniref:locomotion-related protein Hikaru genki-like isoform X2 n=1 Tax=Leptopilina boulardi TaxID=63433 RepID=UPI0021F5F020|nr:locomotion-related protein Hikaru genki-like isoform X2 [Leptopilina boulardi]